MAAVPLACVLGAHFSSLVIETLPSAVVEKAKLVILDCLANAVAGWETPVSREVRQFARTLENSRSKATVWAEGLHALPMDAVFANTTLVHSLLKDDSLPGTNTHGGSMIVPTALTLAEHSGASGARVLAAVAVAFDIQGRLGCGYRIAGPITDKGYRGSPVFGPLAAAAAASMVLGLSAERFAAALNLAANYSSGLLECMGQGSSEYRYQNANAARNGVLSALLSMQGTAVAPTTLDGKHGFIKVFAGLDVTPPEVTEGLGERYEILRVLHKPYPTCGHNIRIVQTLRRAFERNRIPHRDIAGVRLRVHPHSKDYPGCDNPGPFETIDQALMSTQFAVGAVLCHGRIDSTTYRRIDDPEVLDIARRVVLVADASVKYGLLECKAEIALRNGERLVVEASSEDDGMFYLDREAAAAAFHSMTGHVLPPGQRESIVEAVRNLESLADVSRLTSLLVAPVPNPTAA